jgi:hypothetical protein
MTPTKEGTSETDAQVAIDTQDALDTQDAPDTDVAPDTQDALDTQVAIETVARDADVARDDQAPLPVLFVDASSSSRMDMWSDSCLGAIFCVPFQVTAYVLVMFTMLPYATLCDVVLSKTTNQVCIVLVRLLGVLMACVVFSIALPFAVLYMIGHIFYALLSGCCCLCR